MSFASFRDFNEKVVDSGQTHSSTFRKTSAAVTTIGIWCDLSTTPGLPVINFYASTPLAAATLAAKEGLQHGQNQSPQQKYLKRITAMSSSAPLSLVLCDYLLYYPFIDGDSIDEQLMDNTVTLPRYTNGAGVQAFIVSQGTFTGGAQYYIKYTNQDGVSGRISTYCTSNSTTVSGTLISAGTGAGQFGWNIPLAPGDSGIRSVESLTFLSANGGISALVLAKPLASITIREANVPAEIDYLTDLGLGMPEIVDGAYLNFLALPNGSLATVPVYGSIQTVWG
jgi:hypothetical protein